MANPTTNFGWVMPTSTDLVTDLPAQFNTFGQGVDTSMQYLLGGTTGQILSKTSGTNMAFTWIANDQGDITAVTTTAPLQGGSTSGAVALTVDTATTTTTGVVQLSNSTSTTSSVLAATPTAVKSAYDLAAAAIPTSTVTTTGDIIYRNATVPTRLGIGSTSQVLTVAGGVPTWATPATGGGMTLLSTTSLSGSTTTISSIDQTYTKLEIMIVGWTPNTGNADLRCRFNSDSSTHYISGTSGGISSAFSGTYGGVDYGQSSSTTGTANFNWLQIPYYTNTSIWKIAQNLSSESLNATPTSVNAGISLFSWNQTSAINAITFFPSTGTFTGTVYIYGVK